VIEVLGYAALALAALPAGLGAANLRALAAPKAGTPGPAETLVSILIPARDEAVNIGDALAAARASGGVPVEIVVVDDHSTDGTAEVVRAHAAMDPRVRLEAAPPLPPGWGGKNHACQRLAEAARGTHLLFVDADVRLEPHAAAALIRHARDAGVALVSGVPRQETRTVGELLTVPIINFLLLGYLPIGRMRATTQPSLGAACGQLLLVEREAYLAVGGHAAIRDRIHDALALVRRMRAAGHRNDLVAGAGLARVRMYQGFGEAWAGFLKNAHEGMAKPVTLPVWTVLLGGGHVLPPVLVAAALLGAGPLWPPLLALVLSLGLRLAITLRTRESLWGVSLHPLAVATALAIQWTALVRALRGRPPVWKGRAFARHPTAGAVR
jgi:hypothetical protein